MRLKITGQGVAYALAVLLAHRRRVEGFEAYVVASAAFIVMVTFAPRGFDKYALRLLPALLDRADWGRAHGYLKFGVRHTLWTSLFVGLAVGIWARTARDFNADTRLAIIVSCISLPAGALVHFALEVLTAVGRAFTATAIFRIAVPAMALAIVCLLFYLPIRVSGTLAVACWGVAWAVALVMMVIQIRRALPPETLRVVAIEEPSAWERNAWPLCSRMAGDRKVHWPAAVMREDHKHKQQPKCGCRNHEEIDRDDILDVICQEHTPRL